MKLLIFGCGSDVASSSMATGLVNGKTLEEAWEITNKDVIRIDCDVDAPNLYMFYKGQDIEKSEFIGGKKAIEDMWINIKSFIENC